MRVWVDLTNSPHALFFAPIVRHLRSRGDQVLVTARHFAQTVELAERLYEHPVPVGAGSRSSLSGKVYSLGARVRALSPIVRAFSPDVAIGHGSYDQPILARMLGVPALAMVDYEYHPGTHLLFRLATRLLLPEAFSSDLVMSHGGRGKTWRYHGLKEEVYLSEFRPDPQQRVELGIDGHDGPLVAIRPPAVGALYHRHENPLWLALTDYLKSRPDLLAIVLPRHPSQVADTRTLMAAENIRVLDQPVDGPALVWWSDAVISAGGTMNREAAALGTPVWTVFSGRMGSVDEALVKQGRMRRLIDRADLEHLEITTRPRERNPAAAHDVLSQVIDAVDATAAVAVPRRLRCARGGVRRAA